ncbi:hypothetical protein Pfo_018997 [Paulownia fortunei]|nr:hypothetical protein Pfo_018997 [Paulownia fortunei]
MTEPMSDNNAPSQLPLPLLERLKNYGKEEAYALKDIERQCFDSREGDNVRKREVVEDGIKGSASTTPIHWYIMTSPIIDEPTRKFFESRRHFCLETDQVITYQLNI